MAGFLSGFAAFRVSEDAFAKQQHNFVGKGV